jgi:glucose repression mediator protein
MAAHQQPSPTTGMPPHHGGPHPPHAQVNGHPPHANQAKTPSQYLAQLTEAVWTQMGE